MERSPKHSHGAEEGALTIRFHSTRRLEGTWIGLEGGKLVSHSTMKGPPQTTAEHLNISMNTLLCPLNSVLNTYNLPIVACLLIVIMLLCSSFILPLLASSKMSLHPSVPSSVPLSISLSVHFPILSS